jgi:uncharacterized membrane protein YhdT
VSSDHATAEEQWSEDPRYRVSSRESVITAVYFASYIVLTIGSAWMIGGNKSIDEISLVLGFPDWLFWSTFALGGVFCLVPYFLIKYLFTDMSLEADGGLPDSRYDERGGSTSSGPALADEGR